MIPSNDNGNPSIRFRFLFNEEDQSLVSWQYVYTHHKWYFQKLGIHKSHHWHGLLYIDVLAKNKEEAELSAREQLKAYKAGNLKKTAKTITHKKVKK